MFYFNPLDIECKSPAGAIKEGSPVSFTVFVKRRFYTTEANLLLRKDGEKAENRVKMEWRGIRGGFDIYTAEANALSQGLYFYSFEFHNGIKNFSFSNTPSACGCHPSILEGNFSCPCIPHLNPTFSILNSQFSIKEFAFLVTATDYSASERLRGGVMYQIFVDRFAIGGQRKKTRADAEYRDDWGGKPRVKRGADGKILNNDFFGGNLDGVTEKLLYIKELGVTCIYLNPVFKACSNHKYDTGDYHTVDPDFGGNAALITLFKKARAAGIAVILDGVFSHTGADSLYFNKYGKYDGAGAYQSKDSPYYKWYTFKRFPDSYDCWWDIDILPNVNEDELTYNEFINGRNGVIARWLKEGAAGWRLDVADELPDGFLDNLRAAAKTAKKDAIIIGEVWEDAVLKEAYGKRRRYFRGGQLDGVTNYPLRDGIIDFVTGKGAEKLCEAFYIAAAHYPKDAADTLMNVLGTHDTERVLTVIEQSAIRGQRSVADENDRQEKFPSKIEGWPPQADGVFETTITRLKAAAAIQFTAVGVPCVFYGDEAGLTGGKDPYCRGCFPWGRENAEISAFYKSLGTIRKKYGVFKSGAAEALYADKDVFIFRRYDETNPEIITAVNIGAKDFDITFYGQYRCLLTGKIFAGESVLKVGETVVLYQLTNL